MDLAELNNLDFNEIGSWPWPARLALILIIVAAVLGAGFWFDSRNQLAQIDEAKLKETELKTVYELKATKAANLEAYKEQLAEMRESFGTMLRQLPNQTEVADLLVDVSQTGLASGLEFELFQPLAEVPQEFYAELPISIQVRGTYHEFGAFISSVAALPRIVTLHDVTIAPAASGELAMNVTAKTYRYLDAEEAQ